MTIGNNGIIEQAKAFAAKISQSQKHQGFTPTHLHIYTDEDGEFVYAKPRLKNIVTGHKWIRSISQDSAGKWQMKEPDFGKVYPAGNSKKPLYGRHDFDTESDIYIFEGEQKADLAKELGFTTTTSGGSTQIDNYHWQPLEGRTVCLWPDNDSAGVQWLENVYKVLNVIGAHIKVIDIDVLGLAEKGDVVDWVELQRKANPSITDEQLADKIKELDTLADEQLSIILANDIEESSPDILPQDGQQISSELAQAAINQMAALSELDYQLKRVDTAKALNSMSVGVLDKLVKQARSELEAESTPNLVIDTEPYSELVNGASVADEISQVISEHIVCTEGVVVGATLWIIFTWVLEASYIAPIAWINAPEKRCGKSQLLTLLARMSKRSLPTSNITSSALFRCIEKYQPTLTIDEVDTFVNENEDLRGVLNAGYSRDNPYIIRCQGDNNEPTPFYVYGAKALSGIGKIPGTLMDRSISFTLQRKPSNEIKSRVRYLSRDTTDTIKAKLARWSDDNLILVKEATPVLPEAINDRMQDNWEILLKIAAVLGGDWPQRANNACIEISGIEHDEPSLNEQLLMDIKAVFELKRAKRIFSEHLVAALCADDEMHWATHNRGKPITKRQLANRLVEYKISPKVLRIGNDSKRGYDITNFQDAFKCYLPATTIPSVTTLQVNDDKGYREKSSVTSESRVTDRKSLQPLNSLGCNAVTDRNPQPSVANADDVENSSHLSNIVKGVI